MKINHLLFIILLTSITAMMGCKKEPEPSPERPIPEYKLPDDFLRYFAFKPGSYWVYKNKQNGMYDTVTVTKYLFGYHTLISTNGNKALYKYEDFSGQMVSTYYQAIYNYYTEMSPSDIDKNNVEPNYYFNMSNYGPWGGVGDDNMFYYPFQSNKGGAANIISRNDTLTIGTIKYDSLMVFYQGHCKFYYNSAGKTYIKKNIGIVKKTEDTQNYEWELTKYQIIY